MLNHLRQKTKINSGQFLLAFLCFLLITWMIFIATPFDIVGANAKEFKLIPGSSLLLNGVTYWLAALAGSVITYCLLAAVIPSGAHKLLLCIITAIGLSFWLNATFLLGAYGKLDGRESLQIDPSGTLSWIQIGAFLGFAILAFFFRNQPKIATRTVLAVTLITLLTSIINIASKLNDHQVSQASEDQFFTFSKTNPNVLIFLLDEYQGDFFAEILDDNLKNDLAGFTWFKDTAADYSTTIAAIPALLARKFYDENDKDIETLYKNASRTSIANKLSEAGMDISYTPSSTLTHHLFPNQTLVPLNSLDPKHVSIYNSLLNISLFRAMPDAMKPYIYNNGAWLIKLRQRTPYDGLGGALGIGKSFKNLDYFSKKKLNITDGPGTFKFHHSLVTHSPTVLDSDCGILGIVPNTLKSKSAEGRCVVGKVIDTINNLKREGVFDNTMIVITADHGSDYKPEKMAKRYPYNRASVTFLIKPFESNGEFHISDTPAQLSDLPKTITSALGIASTSYGGINLLSKDLPRERTRLFTNYLWLFFWKNAKSKGLTQIEEYEITGPISNQENWRKRMLPLECNGVIDFSEADSVKYYSSDLGTYEKWGRWSNGDSTEIRFKTGPVCDKQSAAFYLKAFTAAKHPEQTASVFVNGIKSGDIRITRGEKTPKLFTFDLPAAQDNEYSIRFEYHKPVAPKLVSRSKDPRELAFGFTKFKLESNDSN